MQLYTLSLIVPLLTSLASATPLSSAKVSVRALSAPHKRTTTGDTLSWSRAGPWLENADTVPFAQTAGNQQYFLQTDGNFVIKQNGQPVWSSGTAGSPTDCTIGAWACRLEWTTTGTFRLIKNGQNVWNSGTENYASYMTFGGGSLMSFVDIGNNTIKTI